MPFVEFKVSQKIERTEDIQAVCRFYEGDFGEPENGVTSFIRGTCLQELTFTFDPDTTDEEMEVLIAEYTPLVSDLELVPEQAALINGSP